MWYCALPGCSRKTFMTGAVAGADVLRSLGGPRKVGVHLWQTPEGHNSSLSPIMQQRQATIESQLVQDSLKGNMAEERLWCVCALYKLRARPLADCGCAVELYAKSTLSTGPPPSGFATCFWHCDSVCMCP